MVLLEVMSFLQPNAKIFQNLFSGICYLPSSRGLSENICTIESKVALPVDKIILTVPSMATLPHVRL